MKRALTTKVSFALAASAIFLVGMLRDPDLANADDLDDAPVAHERMPGYQAVPDPAPARALNQAELVKLNPPQDGLLDTF